MLDQRNQNGFGLVEKWVLLENNVVKDDSERPNVGHKRFHQKNRRMLTVVRLFLDQLGRHVQQSAAVVRGKIFFLILNFLRKTKVN